MTIPPSRRQSIFDKTATNGRQIGDNVDCRLCRRLIYIYGETVLLIGGSSAWGRAEFCNRISDVNFLFHPRDRQRDGQRTDIGITNNAYLALMGAGKKHNRYTAGPLYFDRRLEAINYQLVVCKSLNYNKTVSSSYSLEFIFSFLHV